MLSFISNRFYLIPATIILSLHPGFNHPCLFKEITEVTDVFLRAIFSLCHEKGKLQRCQVILTVNKPFSPPLILNFLSLVNKPLKCRIMSRIHWRPCLRQDNPLNIKKCQSLFECCQSFPSTGTHTWSLPCCCEHSSGAITIQTTFWILERWPKC